MIFMPAYGSTTPFSPDHDFNLSCAVNMWYRHAQLHFSVTVCPTGHIHNLQTRKVLDLNTFEPIDCGTNAAADGNSLRVNGRKRLGSRLYTVNFWMWQYARQHPRLLTMDQTIEWLQQRTSGARKAAQDTETRLKRKAASDQHQGGVSRKHQCQTRVKTCVSNL